MAIARPSETVPSVSIKLALTLALVVATQFAIFDQPMGWPIGGFCLACLAGVLALHKAIWRKPLALAAAGVAAALAVILIDRFSPIGLLFFWVMLSSAALLGLADGFDDVLRWSQRLIAHGFISLFGPLIDAIDTAASLPAGSVRRWSARTPIVILPLVGGVIFLSLFSAANPVLADWVSRIQLPVLDVEFFARTIFAGFVVVIVWGFLRPRLIPRLMDPLASGPLRLSVATLALSLVVFNALFALQNGLDVAFLWSGAPLPGQVTLADYAHRGAYTLILTALLAGAFVLVCLDPGAPASKSRAVRWLLVVWTLQNLFLVASSALRTADYVDAFGLTRLRLAAFVWMGLVAIGLALVTIRILSGRSTGWLANANALALGLVLLGSSAVDYGAIAASWNVHHPKRATGNIDICYLQRLGEPALVSIVELEHQTKDPILGETLAGARQWVLSDAERAQSKPFGWRFRTARRLRAIDAMGPLPPTPVNHRNCLGAAPRPAAPPSSQ
jgi:hypothetical protein